MLASQARLLGNPELRNSRKPIILLGSTSAVGLIWFDRFLGEVPAGSAAQLALASALQTSCDVSVALRICLQGLPLRLLVSLLVCQSPKSEGLRCLPKVLGQRTTWTT